MRVLKPDEDPLSRHVAAERRSFKEWAYPPMLLFAKNYQSGRLRDPEDVAARAFTYVYWQWDANPGLYEIGGSLTLVEKAIRQVCLKTVRSDEKRLRREGKYTQECGTEAAPTGAVEADGTPCLEVVGGTPPDAEVDEDERLWACHLFMCTVPERTRRMLILAREKGMNAVQIGKLMGVSAKTVKRHVKWWAREFERTMARFENGEPVIEELKAKLEKEDT